MKTEKSKMKNAWWVNQSPVILKQMIVELYNNSYITTTITKNGPTEGDLELIAQNLSDDYKTDFDLILQELLLAFGYEEYFQTLKNMNEYNFTK